MFWLSKPFSLKEIRQYLAFSGLEATTDQNERVVVYVADHSAIVDAGEMLKLVIEKNHLDMNPIPCDEKSRLFVQNRLTALPC